MFQKCRVVSVIMFILFFINACSKNTVTPYIPTAEELCQKGWAAYENGSFTEAAESFHNAIQTDDTYCEGFIGLAITRLRQTNLTDAQLQFTIAKMKSPDETQSIAISVGLSFIYVVNNNADGIIAELSDKITGTDTFDIGYGTNINAVDIHNLLCEAYIMINVYGTESGSSINDLDAWGQLKKSMELDPNDTKAIDLQNYLRGTR